jgi:predicted nucleic-acid-binding protein
MQHKGEHMIAYHHTLIAKASNGSTSVELYALRTGDFISILQDSRHEEPIIEEFYSFDEAMSDFNKLTEYMTVQLEPIR